MYKQSITRLGALLASGKLSAQKIKQLRDSGMLRSAETYRTGLDAGNIGIAKKLGLGDDVLRLLSRKDRMLTNANPVVDMLTGKLRPARPSAAGLGRQLRSGNGTVVGFTGFGPKYNTTLKRKYDAFKEAVKVQHEAMTDASMPFTMPRSVTRSEVLSAPAAYNAALGTAKGVRSVINRHELDELRIGAAEVIKRQKAIEATPFIKAYGHFSPEVLVREARNTQGLGDDVIAKIKKMRGSTGSVIKPSEREYMTKHHGSVYPSSFKKPDTLSTRLAGAAAAPEGKLQTLLGSFGTGRKVNRAIRNATKGLY